MLLEQAQSVKQYSSKMGEPSKFVAQLHAFLGKDPATMSRCVLELVQLYCNCMV